MKVLVVGGGGREHAVIRKLRENPEITEIFALPGNAGMRKEAVCVPIGAKDIPAIVNFARDEQIDYAVVTPDDPLVLGCVDALEALGIPCFGPRANAAVIEGTCGNPVASGLYRPRGNRRGSAPISGDRPSADGRKG